MEIQNANIFSMLLKAGEEDDGELCDINWMDVEEEEEVEEDDLDTPVGLMYI